MYDALIASPGAKAPGQRTGLWAVGAGINPRLDKLTEPLLRSRNGSTAKSRIPAPGNEVILREMLMEKRQVASAIAGWIFELGADFTNRLSFPRHFNRSEAPTGMARDALIAGFLHKRVVTLRVTGAARVAGYADPADSAADRRNVD